MGQALYRKYRSRKLTEVVGQEHITTALQRALESKRISHAYLFTGPRGVGKTSIARILAHEVNSLPYEAESQHLDIIEIDAASNRRIDEIRDLRDKVHTAPASASYKVYIIDEVHMLTREAFNALLKTLEEPPAHVIFILATTEAHKLPETIISRTQHFSFKPIDEAKVVTHLKAIAAREKATIDDDALVLIARHGQGSFRDSISMLDQVRSFKDHISLADVESLLGLAPETAVTSLLQAIASAKAAEVVTNLQRLYGQGIEPARLSSQLSQQVRTKLLEDQPVISAAASLALLTRLLNVPGAPDPAASLEICLLETAFQTAVTPELKPAVVAEITVAPAANIAAVQESEEPNEPVRVPTEPREPVGQALPESAPATTAGASGQPATKAPQKSTVAVPRALDNAAWTEVLDSIKRRYNTMYGVLRMAEPTFEEDNITLLFQFPFHQKRINDPKNRKLVIDAIYDICGTKVKVTCTVGSIKAAAKPAGGSGIASAGPAHFSAVSTIFSGAELLES